MPSVSTFLLDSSSKVPLSLRQRLEEASRLSFAQSLEEKKKVERDEINPDSTLVSLTSDEHDDHSLNDLIHHLNTLQTSGL
ncbi:hypothetical protein P8452_33201 [Trifolium repens]|nr:hypothetical protein P8452_33201 [Trifolium repens]